jgi:hypothetical protein
MMAAGLSATAKAMEHPPAPKVGAPVLDPTTTGAIGSGPVVEPNPAAGGQKRKFS